MALKPFNSVDGISVGEVPINVVDANGNVTANSLVVNSTSNLGPIGNITITGGSAGQFITTDGAGNLSFENIGTSNSAAPMPYFIPSGQSYIVNENFQGLFSQPIDIEGSFEVDGILIEVAGTGGGGGGGVPGGSNTQIQYNDAGVFGGSANLTYNKANGIITVPNLVVSGTTIVNNDIIPNANVLYSLGNNTHRFNDLYLSGTTITLGNSTLSANSTSVIITNPSGGRFVLAGNANTSTSVLANGNSNITIANNSSIGITANGVSNVVLITKNGLDVTGTLGVTEDVTSLGNITALGNISGIDVTASGNLSVTGDVSAGNVSVTGSFEASGNLSGININTSGDLSVIGNGNIQTNLYVGTNAVVSTRLSVGNPNGSNITDLYSNGYASLYKLDVVSNIAGNNLTITANANIVGTASIGTLLTSAVNSLGNVTAANITSNGLITSTNANLGNLVIANFFQGDGRYLSNITVEGGTSIVNGNSNVFVEPNANVVFNINGTSNVVTVTATNTYFDTNIIANNSITATVVENGTVSMTIDPIGTSIAFDSGNGNVFQIHDDYVTVTGNTNLNGVVNANSNVFITGNANIATVNASNVNATTANITGNITAGNINGGNTVSANYLVGDGYLISNITIDAGSSIINGNSNVAVAANGNVTITSEGNANVVTVTGNSVIFSKQISVPLATIAIANANVVNANNFNLDNQLVANGDITANGGTLNANALSIRSGNGFYGSASLDGNLNVGTNMFVSGYSNTGQINATGIHSHNSITANNTISANNLTAVYDINTNNLIVNAIAVLHTTNVVGNLTASNINGGNTVTANFLVGDGYLISNLTVPAGSYLLNGTSNLYVDGNGKIRMSAEGTGNVVVVSNTGATITGTLSVTGNANTGNLGTATVLATGNLTANAITSNGNISGTNVSATGNVSVTGNLTSGNANLGNAVRANFFIGDGYLLSNLTIPTGTAIINGDSNVLVTANSNVNITVNGTPNVGQFTEAGFIVTGNIDATGYINGGTFANGSSNIAIANSGAIDMSINGTDSVLSVLSTGVYANAKVYALSGLSVTGNSNIANLGVSGIITTPGALTAGSLTTSGDLSVAGNANLATARVTGALTTIGNISGGNLVTTGTANVGALVVGAAGANINGYTKITANLDVTGNINVTGNLNYSNVTDLVVGDPLIYLGANNTGDIVDLGIVASYSNGTYVHTGIARNHNTNTWTFFDGVVAEPTTVIDWANATYPTVKLGNLTTTGNATVAGNISVTGNVSANYFTGNVTGNISGNISVGSNTQVLFNDGGIIAGNSQLTFNKTTGALSVSGNGAFANVSGGNLVTANYIAGVLTTAAQPNITSVGTLSSLTVTGNVTAGNLIGPHANGNSNINIASANGNILVSVTGTANIAGFTSVGLSVGSGSLSRAPNVGANSALYVVSNISSDSPPITIQNRFATGYSSMDMYNSSNIFMGAVGAANPSATSVPALANLAYLYGAAGASGVGIYATTGNVTISANANANILTVTGTGANVSGTLNSTGNLTAANANLGNLVTANYGIIGGAITGQTYQLVVKSNGINGVFALQSNVGGYAEASFFNASNTQAGGVGYAGSSATYYPNQAYMWSSNGIAFSGNGYSASGGTKNMFIDGSGIVNIPTGVTSTSTTTGALVVTGGVGISGNLNAGNLNTSGTLSTTGNLSAGNVSGGNLVTANYVAGVLTTAAQPNITSVGTLSSLTVTGNITGANILGSHANGNSNVNIPSANGNVTISAAGNANIVVVTGTGANISGTANITGNLSVGGKSNLGSNSNVIITGGSANYVLSTDGAGNLSWVAQSGGGGGSANIAIYDEGNLLTSSLGSMNFVGTGVTATNTGNAVTVTINTATGPASITLDSFTGNGVQTSFNLSVAPTSEDYTFVNIDGVSQLKTSYSVSGTVLTFSAAPGNGASIEVTTVSALSSAQPSLTTRTYTGDGSTTTYTVTSGVTTTGILVTLNGILQTPTTDYTVSGSTLTFTSAPSNGQAIQIRELGTVVATNTATSARALGYSLVFGL